jgi:hypothetical protein
VTSAAAGTAGMVLGERLSCVQAGNNPSVAINSNRFIEAP